MSLWWLINVPLIGALLVSFVPRKSIRSVALGVSLLEMVLGVIAAVQFDAWGTSKVGLALSTSWLTPLGITLDVGADSVSMLLVLLTVGLMPLCFLGSWTAIQERVREFNFWMLLLLSAMVGVFVARDVILFYVAFEFTLIPMMLLIAIYGGSDRARASVKFFIYTFTGSMLTLAGVVFVAWKCSQVNGAWSFAVADLVAFASTSLTAQEQGWVLASLLAGFAVKVPLFPFHTWLPLAHTEAPTAGSVILAGVLLKLGTYGLYRFVLPMVPVAVVEYAPFLAGLSIAGILYAALVCWVQEDVKKLVAYSSVSHLGFCVLGLFALNPIGLQGSVLYMVNHGLSTGALFLLIGMMYERYHTRDMNLVGGLATKMPIWSGFMLFFVLASVGLPGLNGFVSEYYCLLGAFIASPEYSDWPGRLGPVYAALAAIGMILAAMYLLMMSGKMLFGPLREPTGHHDSDLPADLGMREIITLVPLAIGCIWLGVQPSIVTDAMAGSVEATLSAYPSEVSSYLKDVATVIELNKGLGQ